MNTTSYQTFGRTPIYTAYTIVDETNVVDVLRNAIPTFEKNAAEADSLYQYYKGDQPILYREKNIRPDINNTVVTNRAYEIVTFKTGRFLYKDIQYINCNENTNTNEVNQLNKAFYADGKAGKDRILSDWLHIAGHGYRMIIDGSLQEETPFHTYTLDPRRTFVVYSNTVDEKPVLGVYFTMDVNNNKVYTAYTNREIFTIVNYEIANISKHILGEVPIIEYRANYARLGAFEVVRTLLDAINTAESNRLDGIEQFIQALMIFKNLDMDSEQVETLKESGAICIPAESDIEYLVHELNQSQAQTLVDDMYQAVLTICGMPNRNGGSSTSDNKGAVVLRDGWSAAATAVKETRQYFEASERKMLKIALKCFNLYMDAVDGNDHNLKLADVDVHFDEGEYENALERAQVLTMLLSSNWVHPREAYKISNITADPESSYMQGKAFHEEQERKAEEELNRSLATEIEIAKQTGKTEETDEKTEEEDV